MGRVNHSQRVGSFGKPPPEEACGGGLRPCVSPPRTIELVPRHHELPRIPLGLASRTHARRWSAHEFYGLALVLHRSQRVLEWFQQGGYGTQRGEKAGESPDFQFCGGGGSMGISRMRLFPQDTYGRIQFFISHNPTWADRAGEIGATPAAIAALVDRTEAARLAYLRQLEAQQAAQAATQELNRLMEELLKAGSDVVKEIRFKAATEGESIYNLAVIPAPKQPSRIPPPGMPADITSELRQAGELLLRWKCRNPPGSVGTMYQVHRQAGIETSFTFVGSSGEKKFLDTTLPAGAASVTYSLIAVRSTARGSEARYTINLGVSGGGSGMSMQFGRNAA